MRITYVFDLGGVLIQPDVKRCFQTFEKLMGEENMRVILGLDNNGEGDKLDGVYGDEVTLLNNGTWKCTRGSYVSYID